MKYGWQLSREKWERFAVVCRGRQWSRSYLEDGYKETVPKTAGVYIICASLRYVLRDGRLRESLYNAVYVGQATNLRKRFADHVRGYRRVPRAREVFRRLDYWHAPASLAELDEVEQCLIDALGPTANDKNVRVRIGQPVPAGSVRASRKEEA